MRTTTKAIGAALLAAALGATSIAPAAAQSFSFGFGFNGPNYYSHSHRHFAPPRYRPPIYRYPRYPRAGVSIDIGPIHLSVSHIQRCKARFRSYDPRTDTYMGFDHRRHYCRL